MSPWHAWKADQWEESLPTLISVQRQTEMDISLLDSLTFHCENFGKTKYSTKPHTMKLYSFVYQIDSMRPLWMLYRYTEIQTNEWDSVQTYSCLPTTIYQPPTDHLPTTNWPLTDHLPTTNRPLTDHLPTTHQPLTNHLRPPTDHLPTTYQPLFYGAVCSRLSNFWYKVLKQDLSSWKGWHFQLVSIGFRNIMWLQDFCFCLPCLFFFPFSVCILSAVFVESQPIHHQLLHSYNTAHVWDS